MRFDWYSATIPEHPIALVEALLAELAPGGEVREGRGRQNYHQAFDVRGADGDRVALVLAGGPNGHPNATASGVMTDAFVPLVRARWPKHRVARFDAAEDFRDVTAWERLFGVCREVADECRVKGISYVPDNLAEGRTYYLGAPSADVRVRLYEKTAEVRKKLPENRWGEVPDNWVRLETQVRPRKEFKAVAAVVAPEVAWGFSGWSREVAIRAMQLDVERIKMQAGRETDYDRQFRYFIKQWSRLLCQMHHDHGSWECVGLTIGEAIKARQAD